MFGLRQIDILDKDPADFVNVDVGKRTTLEVRDVGLHVKKLIALLKLKLPPEIQLSGARASLLRVTFLLEFGVPQISIEVDGIQVQARLLDDTEVEKTNSDARQHHQTSKSRPERYKGVEAYRNIGDLASRDEEHIPTVDELAKSFIRTEPHQEIYELEQELENQPSYMQESTATLSDDGDEGAAGMGAPLSLPTYLRSILNTALDRLSIAISNIDIEMEDAFSEPTSKATRSGPNNPASLKFHIERISVDTLTSHDARVEVESAKSSDLRLGKRRLRVQNICARLVSDADGFITMSRISQPSSPALTRSDVSEEQVVASISETRDIAQYKQAVESALTEQLNATRIESSITTANNIETSTLSVHEKSSSQLANHSPDDSGLEQSMRMIDDHRFADAASDDGLNCDIQEDSFAQSHSSLPLGDPGNSRILCDDENFLKYAIHNSLFDSRFKDSPAMQESTGTGDSTIIGRSKRSRETHESHISDLPSNASMENLPTVSILGSSFEPPDDVASPTLSTYCKDPQLVICDPVIDPTYTNSPEESPKINLAHSSPGLPDNDLVESQLFTHDEAESMYMSAVSAAHSYPQDPKKIPGEWDSSSSSSKAASSEVSDLVPNEMVTGSILVPLPEVDEGYETPRPASRQTSSNSPRLECAQEPTPQNPWPRQQSKLFLTVDEITVSFPLGLETVEELNTVRMPTAESSDLSFKPPNLGEDSIFAEMPGSFSNYASFSSNRRNLSTQDSVRMRPPTTSSQPHRYPAQSKMTPSKHVGIEVGSIAGHMDISTGRIMLGMLSRTLQAITDKTTHQGVPEKSSEQFSHEISSIELSVKHIGISWLENISAESVHGLALTRSLSLSPTEAILRTQLSGISLTSHSQGSRLRAKVQINRFSIGSLDHEIISFQDSRPRSSRSVGTLTEQLQHDMEVDYEQGTEKRITVITRPVKVVFDIQKLDEALGTFGGFSGMLELSNSISSSNSVQSPVIPPSQINPRGVHFGDGLPPPVKAPPSSTSVPKVQIQFGEVSVAIRGKACAVQLQTTSVRVAVREGNIRLKVSEVQLLGPYVDAGQSGTPLVVDIRGTTINFVREPEETDLARLISLITPSKDPYENNDDILIETLLRQRRKGSVLRAEVAEVGFRISDLQQMKTFEALGTELASLSKVTKYLPDDDRPGLLTLATVKQLDARIATNENLGEMTIKLQNAAMAHVGVPALLAVEVGSIIVSREDEVLVHEVVKLRSQENLPAIMVRMVGDEMEPIAKTKFFNLCVEYRVSTVMAALGISEAGRADDLALGIASSVATITGASTSQILSKKSSQAISPNANTAKPLQIDLLLRNCAIGLNPGKAVSKGLFVLTEAHISGKQVKNDYSVVVELRKASMHAIDDISRLNEERDATYKPKSAITNRYLQELSELGFVSLSSISAAEVYVNITGPGNETPQLVDVEFKNQLFVIESCADSTQTLIAILNGLQPPTPPSTAEKYRTVVPLQEMMESFTGDAFVSDNDTEIDEFMQAADLMEDEEEPTNLEFVGSFYHSQPVPTDEEMSNSLLSDDKIEILTASSATQRLDEQVLLDSFQERHEVSETEPSFDFNEPYFVESDSERKGKARKWDSTKNQYHLSNEFKAPDAPLKVRVRDVNVIWNLYDGYDWPRTRSIITQAVEDVEARAEERRQQSRDQEDDDFVEEDFLFNSVWIGVPVKDEKGALARRINHDIDDLVSETGSYATSTATRSTGATARSRGSTKSRRRLKLERSKHKKIAFSVMGISVDLIVFPPGTGENISSVDVRIQDLEIFDHVPTSTWKKFVTCAVDPAARELNRPMVNLELVTVRPVTDLAASELVIKVTVLPLRLHVDQDALDFITRFFEFKDESVPVPPPVADQPFIQRLEVMAVSMKLDYKPKRVDYRGLRSGHTTEFMNFLILDGSDITLRHAIVYGITSFDKLHKTLNDVWSPDVKSNQLPGVLAGLAAVRPLVNVGSGMRDLVVVPVRAYKKDGRIVRSLQKGMYAFAKNTTSEVARLGAKVAIGTQTLLEGAEVFLNPQTGSSRQQQEWDGEDPASDAEEPRAVSHYANQPLSVRAGLQSAARHLERDLLTARDAVIAIPQEVMEEGSGVGVAKAIARHAPTIVIKPALGATKALSNALLGVGNALDQDSRRKIEDKYKSY